jgi:hypothetical protein
MKFEPTEGQAENIIIGGEKVGGVKPAELWPGKFIATIILVPPFRGIACGIGDTREEATMDALRDGREQAEKMLVRVAELEAKLTEVASDIS